MKTMFILLVWAAGTTSYLAQADSDLSSQQIRALVSQGKILSLDSIMQKHPQFSQGRLLDMEVESEYGKIIYEFELLLKNGRVMELEIDAVSGEILQQEIER